MSNEYSTLPLALCRASSISTITEFLGSAGFTSPYAVPMIFSYCPTPGHEKPPKAGFWESVLSTTIFVMRASAAGAASIAPAASARAMFTRRAGFISSSPLSTSNTSALARRAALIAVAAVVIIVPVAVALVLRFRVAARIARRLADIARAGVAQRLRLRAKRPAARGRQAGERTERRGEAAAARDHLFGGDAVLDPVHHRRQHVEIVGRGVAAAVAHVRDEVELHELVGMLEAAVAPRHVAEILERVRPRRTGVAQAMVENQLAAAPDEALEVGRVVHRGRGRRADVAGRDARRLHEAPVEGIA